MLDRLMMTRRGKLHQDSLVMILTRYSVRLMNQRFSGCGMKIGHFNGQGNRNVKLVMWTQQKIFMVPFNPDLIQENGSEFKNNRVEIEIQDFEKEMKIVDFAIIQEFVQDYDEDICELLLVQCESNAFKIMKGYNYGKGFENHIKFDQGEQLESNEQILNIFEMKLISGFKIVAFIEKENDKKEKKKCVQIFDFDKMKKENPPKMTFDFNIWKGDPKKVVGQGLLSLDIVEDQFNNFVYIQGLTEGSDYEEVHMLSYNNNQSYLHEKMTTSQEVVKNIVGSHKKQSMKAPSGLLYSDFIVQNNHLYIIHGKVISIFNLVDIETNFEGCHLQLDLINVEETSYYKFDKEPTFIWSMDKQMHMTENRWKVIVSFENGQVKEVGFDRKSQKFALREYLINQVGGNDTSTPKINGKILRVFANQNNSSLPVYFEVQTPENKKVLATIEIQSKTARYFSIPGAGSENTTYIILGFSDKKMFWQEVIAIVSKKDSENKTLTQKLTYAKLRVGQSPLESSKEVIVLNKETLNEKMKNVSKANDIYVCDDYIYFVYPGKGDAKRPVIEKYDMKDNSFFSITLNENITSFKIFKNQFFYWRTQTQGSKQKHLSQIFFDKFEDFTGFQNNFTKDQCILEGSFPHLSKLYYDEISQTVSGFLNVSKFICFPLLHLPNLKVKVDGHKINEGDLIHVKLIEEFSTSFIYTVNSLGLIVKWDMDGKKVKSYHADHSDLVKNFIWHQKVSEEMSLIREKEPIFSEPVEANGEFNPNFNQTDEKNEINMHKFQVVKLKKVRAGTYQLEIVMQFIGPHINQTNAGIYVGNTEMTSYQFRAIFSYIDIYSKLNIEYFEQAGVKWETDWHYLKSRFKQTEEHSKISLHSPDFTRIVANAKQQKSDKEQHPVFAVYELNSQELGDPLIRLPLCLSKQTVCTPRFISKDTVICLSSDNILKGINIDNDFEEDFMTSHCYFPGRKGKLNANSIEQIKIGKSKHIIGENFLIYTRMVLPIIERTGGDIELMTNNYFNQFYSESTRGFKEDMNFQELKFIQTHYKNKIELNSRGSIGYVFMERQTDYDRQPSHFNIIFSFTYYHWRLLNMIADKKVSVESLSLETLQELLFTQIQEGTSLLHKIYREKKELDLIYSKIIESNLTNQEFFIPLLKNSNNKTALDNALLSIKYGKEEEKAQNDPSPRRLSYIAESTEGSNPMQQPIFGIMAQGMKKKIKKNVSEEGGNIVYRKQAEVLLKMIEDYPFDLFKVDLYSVIPSMIHEKLIQFPQFIEKQAKTPQFLKEIDRGVIYFDEDFGANLFQIDEVWSKEIAQSFAEINDSQSNLAEEEKQASRLLQLKIIDIPFVHWKENKALMDELVNTDNQQIYESSTIKAIIESQWPETIRLIIWKLCVPYAVFLLMFTLYTTLDLESVTLRGEPSDSELIYSLQFWFSIQLRVGIVLCSIYFIYMEVVQMKEGVQEYVSNLWNYQDNAPLFLNLAAEIAKLCGADIKIIRTFYSFAAVTMWLRFLYFLRMNKKINFYVRMVGEVISDMTQFFVIFLIAIISFGHAYYILFKNHDNLGELDIYGHPIHYEQEFDSIFSALLFSYQMAFGEFNLDNFDVYQPVIAWMFFILSTLFVIIVLLNLLISIVGNTFDRVNSNKSTMMYQDMANFIVENRFLRRSEEEDSSSNKKYLVIVIPDDQIQEEQDTNQKNFEALKKQITEIRKEMEGDKRQVNYQILRILAEQKEIKDSVKLLVNHFNLSQ